MVGVSSESDPRPSAEQSRPGPDGSAPAADDRATPPGAPDPATSGGASDAGVPGEATRASAGDPGAQAQRPRQQVGPRAFQKPARTETRMKDMLGALLILIPVALLIVGVSRSCSFAPLGPTVDPGAGPTADAPARLAEYARASTFPLRVPDVGWRSNSTDRGPVEGGGTAVRVGYLTQDARYLRLVQSDASEENLLRTEAGDPVPTGRGVIPAAGVTWVDYGSERGEPFRIATVPTPGAREPVRLLITGSGTDDEFRALADATLRATPLPPGRKAN